MSELLRVENLKKYFKTSKGLLHAVDDVSFTIEKGQTLGVVGESGCGKSTLGRTVIHLLDKTDGQIYFNGQEISNVKGRELKQLRCNMQMIFQDPFSSLNPRMTVAQSIAEPMKVYHTCSNRYEMEKKITDLMDTVGLALRFKNAYPHELDGGRRQRIGVARALALDPDFIVCDEPVSALDVSIQAQILNLLMDLQDERGLTYIFITHDLSVVKHISDYISVMYLGNMVEKCSSDGLFEKPLHPYTKALLAAIPSVNNRRGTANRSIIRGEITTPVNPKPGCRFAVRCEYACDRCFKENPVLEEIVEGHFSACHRVREVNGL